MEFACFDSSSINLDLNIGFCGGGGNSLPSFGRRGSGTKEELGSLPLDARKDGLAREEVSALEEELIRMSEENKMLNEKLTAMQESYNKLLDYLTTNANYTASSEEEIDAPTSRAKKRKSSESCVNGIVNGGSTSSDDSCKRIREEPSPKISKLCVRTDPSDASLVVKDGYQWRKYGQKVTRDNPCPRAYFRCSFAPACPVKKKVQRSADDRTLLVATYEGEHTHPSPALAEPPCGNTSNTGPRSASAHPSGPAVTLGSSRPQPRAPSRQNVDGRDCSEAELPEFQRRLAEQMASSLTKDPGFTAALASTISGRFLRFSY